MADPLNADSATLLLNHVRDVFTFIDHSGVILFQSRSLKEFFGYPPEEVIGTDVIDLLHPDDQAEARESLTLTVSQAEVNPRLVSRIKHKNGSWRWIEVVAQLVDDGDLHGVLLHTRDVTTRQSALESVKRSERLFEAMFQATSVMHTITNPETSEYISVNGAFTEITGWSEAEVLGKTALELGVWGTPDNRARVMRALEESDGSLRGFRASVQTRHGESRTMLFDIELLELPEGNRMFLSGIDITDREMIEQQLRQSQKMEAVGQLTGGIAHDFNNLLGVIIGHAEMLNLNPATDEKTRTAADAILRAADNGAELIKNLLSFSRQGTANALPVVIPQRLNSLVSLLRTTLGKDIKLVIENHARNAVCTVDAAQLDSAIINLAINAREAMPDGGKLSVTVGNRQIEPDSVTELIAGEYVEITIADTGIGMSEEIRQRAFEPFFTTRQTGGGTGLGLSMVFGFARQSYGDVKIESVPGQGTRVSLILPATNDTRGTEAQRIEVPAPTYEGLEVLVVEDNPDVRRLVEMMLGAMNLEVTSAASGTDATQHIDKQFDLIVSDVMLPGNEKGPEIAARFRQKLPDIPVLYMSGFQPGVLSGEELERPGVGFIQKPFTRDDFNELIFRLLGDKA